MLRNLHLYLIETFLSGQVIIHYLLNYRSSNLSKPNTSPYNVAKFLLLEFSSEKKSSAIFANQELIIYSASLFNSRSSSKLESIFHVCSHGLLEMEGYTGFEPVMTELQSVALGQLG